MENAIAIPNAGLVLLNSYIPLLFERLGLTANGQFSSSTHQMDAVHYLQFLATGLSETEEHYVPLNKVLCGLAVTTPIASGITISEENKALMHGLLQAAIGHWPAIGDSSIVGFRGNWLVREGLLNEEANHWTLRVEKRPYDLLINKAPFSFSIVHFPWMPKTLQVNWPY